MGSTLEIAGTIFGFLAVYLTIKENIWCWFFGLIQVTIFVFIFYSSKLYSDMILHIIYIFLQIFGWYQWKYGGKNKSELQITKISHSALLIALTVIGTSVLGYLMLTKTDASYPFPDAFTTTASLVAQYLMIKKKLGSWLFWIVVDIVAIGVYFYKDLYYTTGLYVAFLVMAIIGYFQWKKTYQNQLEYAK